MAGVTAVNEKELTEQKMKKVTETKWVGPTLTLTIGALPAGHDDGYSNLLAAKRMMSYYCNVKLGNTEADEDTLAKVRMICSHLTQRGRRGPVDGLVVVVGLLPSTDPTAGGPLELISYVPLTPPPASIGQAQLMLGDAVVADS